MFLPDWWLKAVRRKTQGLTLTEVAKRLTAAVRRPIAWDHTTVGNFLRNEHATIEMLDAFLKEFPGLIPPVFTARSHEEAHTLLEETRKFEDDAPQSGKDERLARLDSARDILASVAEDQGVEIPSEDATRGDGRRRPRGVVRSRPPTSGS